MSTRAQILAEIASQFPDNNSGLITPAKLRQVCEDLANSCNNVTEEGTIPEHNADPAAHLNIVRRTLAGNLTVTAADYAHQRIIPDADRDVILPAETAGTQWRFLLCHAGPSFVLTVKRAGGTTVGVIIPSGAISAAWDGTAFGIC